MQIETDNKVENYDVNKIVNSNNVTFLSDGDMFSRSYTQSQNKQTIYRTEPRINFWEDSDLWNAKYSLGFNESFYYMTSNSSSFSRLGTFSSNPSELPTSNMLDSLFAPNMGNAYRQILINRQQQESMGNGDFLSNLTSVNGMTKVGKNDNVLSLGAFFQYQKKVIVIITNVVWIISLYPKSHLPTIVTNISINLLTGIDIKLVHNIIMMLMKGFEYIPIIHLTMIINQIKVIFIDWTGFRAGKQKILPCP